MFASTGFQFGVPSVLLGFLHTIYFPFCFITVGRPWPSNSAQKCPCYRPTNVVRYFNDFVQSEFVILWTVAIVLRQEKWFGH